MLLHNPAHNPANNPIRLLDLQRSKKRLLADREPTYTSAFRAKKNQGRDEGVPSRP
jgi:hypothetical protein